MPNFCASLKNTQNKKFTVEDTAEVSTVPSTICLAVITGKSGKTNNFWDKSFNIDNNKLYIDSDGYLTNTPANNRADGYYVLGKDESVIFKTPNGKLITTSSGSAEPKIAVDVLKDEIRNTDNENIAAETEIENLIALKEKKIADTNEKVADLESKTQRLNDYYNELIANHSVITNISEEKLRPICDKDAEFLKNNIFFDREKAGKKACRSYSNGEVSSLLDNEVNIETIDVNKGAKPTNKKNNDRDSLLDETNDIDSLLNTLQEKRKVLAENQKKLKVLQDTFKSCDERLNSSISEFNEARTKCLDSEKSIMQDDKFKETFHECQRQAQKDYKWLNEYEMSRDFTGSEIARIHNCSNYASATWEISDAFDNHVDDLDRRHYTSMTIYDYKQGLRPKKGKEVGRFIYDRVYYLYHQRLGHLPKESLKIYKSLLSEYIDGIDNIEISTRDY